MELSRRPAGSSGWNCEEAEKIESRNARAVTRYGRNTASSVVLISGEFQAVPRCLCASPLADSASTQPYDLWVHIFGRRPGVVGEWMPQKSSHFFTVILLPIGLPSSIAPLLVRPRSTLLMASRQNESRGVNHRHRIVALSLDWAREVDGEGEREGGRSHVVVRVGEGTTYRHEVRADEGAGEGQRAVVGVWDVLPRVVTGDQELAAELACLAVRHSGVKHDRRVWLAADDRPNV
ncbi:hypothetical protein L210DRAFT_3632473 [Boletus edulis BED1]|uniref:Uncharacterized protein n=1 Tax=Boletus edulis BED1 TaxID=1328754 RepID=A0AAD4BNC7_BOLED|nr:hypothetical protein L210DRAFT_3632473 [Boletus edulis BED1]